MAQGPDQGGRELPHERHELTGARAKLDGGASRPGHEPERLPAARGPTKTGIRIIEREELLKVTAQALEFKLPPMLALVRAQPEQQSQPGAVAVRNLCRVEDEAGRRLLLDPGDRIAPDSARGLDVEATEKAQAERPLRARLEDERGLSRRAERRFAGSHRELLRAGQPAGEVGEALGHRKAG